MSRLIRRRHSKRFAGVIVAPALTLLASCAGNFGTTPQEVPAAAARPHPAWYRAAPALIKQGSYVAEYFTNAILGYAGNNKSNLPPICSIAATFVVDVATDPFGDLIDPDGGSKTVSVFHGPAMCGAKLGSFSDSAGQPSDAATHNARTGTIYVANIQAAGKPCGNVSVCTLAHGCGRVLSSSAIGGQLFAVAEDSNGNVYASGYPNPSVSGPGSGASLVYWKNGTGKAAVVSAYRNSTPGGLDVDARGNLIAFDTFGRAVWVYTGCPAHCAAHGPFALKGESVFGKVNAKNTMLQVADFEYGQVDVYQYNGTSGVRYLYSYNDGITPSGDVEGIALSP